MNDIVGNVWLGILLGLLLIYIMGIKYRIPDSVILMICALWGLIVFNKTGIQFIYILIVFLVAFYFYYNYNKWLQGR